jgi:hypothetical protein
VTAPDDIHHICGKQMLEDQLDIRLKQLRVNKGMEDDYGDYEY